MKKTLLAALAFVMVLATVLTCSVLAADEPEAAPMKAADIKMVDEAHPILVDGKMDQAYQDATPLYIDTYTNATVHGVSIFTYGVARFVWSPSENAVYCFVIMNDADVGETHYNNSQLCLTPWCSDSIELYVDYNDPARVPDSGYGAYIDKTVTYERGFQYRIDGHTGMPSCLMVEEPDKFAAAHKNPDGTDWKHPQSNQTANVYNGSYHLNEETGKFENMLDSAMADYFGWGYSEDITEIGWGHQPTDHGYTAEFRIECKERTLAVGEKVFFDFQVNDMYEETRSANKGTNQLNIYYTSQMRKNAGTVVSDNREKYDWLVLSDEVATNDEKPLEVNDKKMYELGMEDVSEGRIQESEPVEIIKTEKKTWTRRPVDFVAPGANDNQQGGDDNQQGGNQQGGSGTTEEPAGGCGSSITVSASIAMVAAVALGGALAFRRKDEE